MLEEVLKSYKEEADLINWRSYDQNELFFKYIENESDEIISSRFYAGIVCRYWGYTGRLYLKCNKHITFEQCYDILIDTINYVLEKRVWQNPESSLYNDPAAPDKAFHIVLKRQLGIVLASLSAEKRKANFNALSIDALHEDYSDAGEGLFGLVDETSEGTMKLITYISSMRSTLDIIILDQICFSNWTTLKNIARNVKSISINNYDYYADMYLIDRDSFEKCISVISNYGQRTLLNYTKKLLFSLKSE